MKGLQIVALILTIIGAINWGLVAVFNFNLVAYLFGDRTLVTLIIYGLVAIAGLINIGLLVDLFEHDYKFRIGIFFIIVIFITKAHDYT